MFDQEEFSNDFDGGRMIRTQRLEQKHIENDLVKKKRPYSTGIVSSKVKRLPPFENDQIQMEDLKRY